MKKILKIVSIIYLLFFVQIISVSAKTYAINSEVEGSYDVVPDFNYVLGTHMYTDLTKIDYLEIIAATHTSNEENPIIYQKLFGSWYNFDGDKADVPNNNGLICISSIDGKTLDDVSCAGTALTVTFDISKEEQNPKVSVLVGQKLSADDVPTPQTKRGYKFVCWIDNSIEDYEDESSCFDFGKSVNKNVTLKPYYEAITYTINFDLNGLESSTADTTSQKCNLEALGDCKLPTIAEARKGYTFDGWSTVKDENGDQGTHFEGGESMVDMLGESNEITLYAVWKPQTYTITYDLDGGTYRNLTTFKSTYNILDTLGEKGIELFTPSMTGYTFDGWEVTDDDSENAQVNNADGNYTLKVTNVKDLKLKAKWKEKEYTISYDLGLDDESGLLKTMVSDEELEEPDETTCGFESGCTLAKAPEREEYIFAGWADEDGYLYSEEKVYKGIDFKKSAFTLTAQWHEKNEPLYDITYDLDGGKFTTEALDKYGRTTLDYTLPEPEKTGYTFAGWCKDHEKNQCDKVEKISDVLGEDEPKEITVYAKWEANTYTIKFYEPTNLSKSSLALSVIDFSADDYTVMDGKDVECTYGETCELTDHSSYFEAKNERLRGWSLTYGAKNNNNSIYLSDGIEVMNLTATDEAEVNLYAIAEEYTYTLKYYLDGGSFGEEGDTHPEAATKGQKVTIKNPTKDGYTFEKWVDENGGDITDEGSEDGSVSVTVNKDMILVAVWKKDYQIDFYLDGGTLNEKEQLISEKYKEGSVVEINNPTKEGYKFVKWVDKDGQAIPTENSEPQDETKVKIKVTSDLLLIATWEQNDPEITIEPNDGETVKKGEEKTFNVGIKANNKKGFTVLLKATVTKGDGQPVSENVTIKWDSKSETTNGEAKLGEDGNIKLEDTTKTLTVKFENEAEDSSNYKLKIEILNFNYQSEEALATKEIEINVTEGGE